MAVSISYSLVNILSLDLSAGPSTVATDVAALAGGGFVAAGNFNGHTALDFFDANGNHTGGNTSLPGLGASVLGLADGNVTVASIVSKAPIYSIRALDGTIIVGDTQTAPGSPDTNPSVDVASLGGHDVVVAISSNGLFGGTPIGASLTRIVNGSALLSLIPKQTSAQTLSDLSVSGYGNGNVVATYTSEDSSGSSVGLVFWDANDTSFILTPTFADNRGTISRNPSVVDIPGAGFGIAYETDSQSDSLDIVFSLFSDTGTRLATFDISNASFASQGFDETNATASMVTDTLVAITYSARDTSNRNNPTVSKVALFDLATNTTVAGLSISSFSLISSINPLVAGSEDGLIAFFATNTSSGSDAFGRLLGVTRTQFGDAANDLITGDQVKDVMFGGDGNDTLTGGIGAANDLHGGLGDDRFLFAGGQVAAGEVIAGDDGVDRFLVSASTRLDLATITSVEAVDFVGTRGQTLTLAAAQFGFDRLSGTATVTGRNLFSDRIVVLMGLDGFVNLSGLVLTNWQDNALVNDRLIILGDSDAETAIGTALADVINLGNGDDVLHGGLGRDVLTGGLGVDRFVFTAALGGGNVDRITDFATAIDQLRLDDAVFTGLALGKLANSAFEIGTQATSANDRIIYDSATGALFLDADGTGATAQVRFATLVPGTTLVAADIFVM